MSFSTTFFVSFPRDEVWQWHTRRGAVARLTPPFALMRPVSVADSLADGTTTFAFPGGLKWVARHDLTGYRKGHSFVDVCVSAPVRKFAGWRHVHTFADAAGGTLITDEVTTRVPTQTVQAMFAYRQQQLLGDMHSAHRLAPLLAQADSPKTVAITGSRGLVGRALAAFLDTLGIQVIQLVRKTAKPGQRRWDPFNPASDLLDGVDAVIHLAGEPIFGRFSSAHKQAMWDSRVEPTRRLAEAASKSASCRAFISASAVGFYGSECGVDEPVTEAASAGSGFLAELCAAWEEAARADSNELRVVHVRTGVVLSGRGGLLPVFRGLTAAGLGGNLGSGEQRMSWISLDDLVDLYARCLLDPELSGPLNAVSPAPVTNAVFVQALGRELRRPTFLPVPTLGPRLLLGSEGATELALADQRVSPAAARAAGFTYRYPELAGALAHELGGESLPELG